MTETPSTEIAEREPETLLAAGDEFLAVPDDEGWDEVGPRQYVIIFVVLAIVTALEVAVSYLDGDVNSNLLILILAAMAAAKFVLVVSWYMHTKFDLPLFRRLFTVGLVGATIVYVVMLTSMAVMTRLTLFD